MNLTIRRMARVFAGAAMVSACVVACTSTVDGTALAPPDAAPLTTTTSPPGTSATARPGQPTVPPVPTRTATPGSPAADTTCDEYVELDEAAQRDVLTAIGEENELVALNPELWITLTSALCAFAEPSTTVREVLAGQGIR